MLFARTSPVDGGLPRISGGSAPALSFSRPAQRSLTLRPACSPSRLKRPSTPKASAASLPPPPLRLLPGGANQFPGGTFTRCETSAFPRRTEKVGLAEIACGVRRSALEIGVLAATTFLLRN